MTYTGIMLFITPKGKIAKSTNWEIFGLTKTQYSSLHATFMVLFLLGMVLHIYLNWKPLMMYLKNKNRKFSLLTKEFLLAFGFTLVFLLGTLYDIAPFKTFLDFQKNIKISWEKNSTNHLYRDTELSSLQSLDKGLENNEANTKIKEGKGNGLGKMSLEEICYKYNIKIDSALSIINKNSQIANKNSKIKQIAETLEMSPTELLNTLK